MGASEIYLWLVDAGGRADGREATNLIPDGSYPPRTVIRHAKAADVFIFAYQGVVHIGHNGRDHGRRLSRDGKVVAG
jgi:hypothetical protein